MDPNAYLSYRIIQQRTEDAARRAEYARMAAAHPEQTVRRIGIVRRMLLVLTAHRASTEADCPSAAPGAHTPRAA